MTLICISSFWESVLTGIIASISFAILFYIIQTYRYWNKLTRNFNERTFNTYWKRFPDEIVQEVKCSVKRNIITFKGRRVSDGADFSGELIINPVNLKIGEGFHSHINSDGYGFLKIIIKDEKCFLVEAPYTAIKENESKNKYGTIIPQAFIWRRVD